MYLTPRPNDPILSLPTPEVASLKPEKCEDLFSLWLQRVKPKGPSKNRYTATVPKPYCSAFCSGYVAENKGEIPNRYTATVFNKPHVRARAHTYLSLYYCSTVAVSIYLCVNKHLAATKTATVPKVKCSGVAVLCSGFALVSPKALKTLVKGWF